MKYITDEFADSSDLDYVVDEWADSHAFDVEIEEAYGVNEIELFVKVYINDSLNLNKFRDIPEVWYKFNNKLISKDDLFDEAEATQVALIEEFEAEMVGVLEYELSNSLKNGCKKHIDDLLGVEYEEDIVVDVEITISHDSFDPDYLIEEKRKNGA